MTKANNTDFHKLQDSLVEFPAETAGHISPSVVRSHPPRQLRQKPMHSANSITLSDTAEAIHSLELRAKSKKLSTPSLGEKSAMNSMRKQGYRPTTVFKDTENEILAVSNRTAKTQSSLDHKIATSKADSSTSIAARRRQAAAANAKKQKSGILLLR